MFGLFGSGKETQSGGAILIGEECRRSHVKWLLAGSMRVEAELASERRVHLLTELSPEVIVLDCASEGINPFVALSSLAEVDHTARIVALMEGSVPRTVEEALTSLGADATADILDSHEVLDAVLPDAKVSRKSHLTAA